MIDTKPQIQEAQRTNRIKNPQKIYTQEYHSQTAKKTKTEKNLEREKINTLHIEKQAKIKIKSDFSSETTQV